MKRSLAIPVRLADGYGSTRRFAFLTGGRVSRAGIVEPGNRGIGRRLIRERDLFYEPG
jgi:hypothetical protein